MAVQNCSYADYTLVIPIYCTPHTDGAVYYPYAIHHIQMGPCTTQVLYTTYRWGCVLPVCRTPHVPHLQRVAGVHDGRAQDVGGHHDPGLGPPLRLGRYEVHEQDARRAVEHHGGTAAKQARLLLRQGRHGGQSYGDAAVHQADVHGGQVYRGGREGVGGRVVHEARWTCSWVGGWVGGWAVDT